MFSAYLEGYDQLEADYLLNGFSKGFQIFSDLIYTNTCCRNLPSAVERPDIVTQKIEVEVASGRFMGPLVDPPFQNFQVSPIGLCPKKEPNKFRMIHHLSYPKGNSVNDHILPEMKSVNYTRIDDAISTIKLYDSPVYMAKCDIEMAYRNLPLSPSEYHKFGICWNGLYYFDKCLAMGCASACQIFERFSSALEWIGQCCMPNGKIIHILDDFLIIAPGKDLCKVYLDRFLYICKQIGTPMAPSKTLGPVQVLTFLGIELDTITNEARLPQEKIVKCLEQIDLFLPRRKVTLKEIQMLCGLLNFATKVVVAGRPFLRRLYDLTYGLRKPHHRVKLSKGCRDDLQIWKEFLSQFNGKCFFMDENWVSSDKLELFTDASGQIGYGAVFGSSWFYGVWNKEWLNYNITVKEFYPIILAAELWGETMASKAICFHCDNEALVYVINNLTSQEKHVMKLLRKLIFLSLKYNILFKAVHIPGEQNKYSDALSRLQIQKFLALMPEADQFPMAVPTLPKLPC